MFVGRWHPWLLLSAISANPAWSTRLLPSTRTFTSEAPPSINRFPFAPVFSSLAPHPRIPDSCAVPTTGTSICADWRHLLRRWWVPRRASYARAIVMPQISFPRSPTGGGGGRLTGQRIPGGVGSLRAIPLRRAASHSLMTALSHRQHRFQPNWSGGFADGVVFSAAKAHIRQMPPNSRRWGE